MAKVFIEEDSLTAIGNAIRAKTGTTEALTVPTGMVNAINSIGGAAESIDLISRNISGDYENEDVVEVGGYAFTDCVNLTSVTLPSATTIGRNAFQYCSSIKNIDIPSVESISNAAFHKCTDAKNVRLNDDVRTEDIINVGPMAFQDNSSLERVDFGTIANIQFGRAAFINCTNLAHIILRSNQVVTPFSDDIYDIFGNTPFNNAEGYIYVPSSLLTQYQASDWTQIGSNVVFRRIEHYSVICDLDYKPYDFAINQYEGFTLTPESGDTFTVTSCPDFLDWGYEGSNLVISDTGDGYNQAGTVIIESQKYGTLTYTVRTNY